MTPARIIVVALLALTLGGCSPIFAVLLAAVPHTLLGVGTTVPNLGALGLTGLRAEQLRQIIHDARIAYRIAQKAEQVAATRRRRNQ